MKLHHIGIACSDIMEKIDQIKCLFPVESVSEIVVDPEQDAELCMVYMKDSTPLELIAGNVVQNLVKKNISLYHTCWEVEEMEKEITRMCDEGSKLISEPKAAVLFDFRRVAFLHTPAGIVELLECIDDKGFSDAL